MATMKYLSASAEFEEIGNFYGIGDGGFSLKGKETAKWIDDDTGNTITLKGSNMKFEQGVLVSGKVEKVLFEDFEGADYGVVTGNFNGKGLGKVLDNGTVTEVVEYLSKSDDLMIGTTRPDYMEGHKGNDVIKTGAGDDRLWGGTGDDRLVGGVGNDTFHFELKSSNYAGDGHDAIVGFDANGGLGNQDMLGAARDWVTDVNQSGKNTVVEFFGGGSMTLLNVKASDITADDFAYVS